MIGGFCGEEDPNRRIGLGVGEKKPKGSVGGWGGGGFRFRWG